MLSRRGSGCPITMVRTVGIGATSPFTRASVKVGSPPVCNCRHCGVDDIRPGKLPESELAETRSGAAQHTFGSGS
jgi:hypothetical protein